MLPYVSVLESDLLQALPSWSLVGIYFIWSQSVPHATCGNALEEGTSDIKEMSSHTTT